MKRDRITTYQSTIVLIICSYNTLYSSENNFLKIPPKESFTPPYSLFDEIKHLESQSVEQIEQYLASIKSAHDKVRKSLGHSLSKEGEVHLKRREDAIHALLYRKKHPILNIIKQQGVINILSLCGCAIITYACWKLYHCYTTTNTSKE